MSRIRYLFLCFIVCISTEGINVQADEFGARCESLLLKGALISTGLLADTTKMGVVLAPPIVYLLADTGLPKWPAFAYPYLLFSLKKKKGPFALTGRGITSYLMNFRLMNYDFSGKTVLDVGAGKSNFSQVINWVYKSRGTVAIPLDKFVVPPGPHAVQADAANMPFPDKHFDLIVSSWAFYYVRDTVNGFDWLREMLRVAKPGGQIKLRTIPIMDFGYTKEFLSEHPQVESWSERRGFPSAFEIVLEIKLKNETLDREEVVAFETDWLAAYPNIPRFNFP